MSFVKSMVFSYDGHSEAKICVKQKLNTIIIMIIIIIIIIL
jgi:hypothetical protein